MECLIVKACTSFIDLKVGVLLDHGALLRFVSTCWAMLQAKNNVKNAPASSALKFR